MVYTIKAPVALFGAATLVPAVMYASTVVLYSIDAKLRE